MLGYAENPAEHKFDPPGSGRPDTTRASGRSSTATGGPGQVDDDLGGAAGGLGRAARRAPGRRPANEHVDRMVNIWNPYQCMVTFNLSRSASMFESGIGRGMGFRDSNQDLLGFVHMVPERARARILDIAATQLPDGGAYHQYQPLTKRGNDDVGSGFNDDPAWLVLGVAAYLKETGDLAILDEPVPWDNEPTARRRRCTTTCGGASTTRSIGSGPHGLPLIGRADWNDCLNLNCFSDRPGESFQTAPNRARRRRRVGVHRRPVRARGAGGRRRSPGWRGDEAEAARCAAAAAAMTAAIEAHGWDGAWFRRAYDHFGRARRARPRTTRARSSSSRRG